MLLIRDLKIVETVNELRGIPLGKLLINTVNAYSFDMAQDDELFAEALRNGDYLIPDGAPILAACWLLKAKSRPKERIAGWDLFQLEMDSLNQRGGTCFFMGSSENVLNLIRKRAATDYPNIKILTYSPPYKPVFSAEDSAAMIQAINAADPDQLWIGMTAPKQEKWVYEHWGELDIHCHCGTIGAVFDFYAGTAKRAPLWMQRHSLEWLHRLISNPPRMWRRYLIGNPQFIWNVFKEWINPILPSSQWEKWQRKHNPLKYVVGLNLPMRRFVELVRCGAVGAEPDGELFRSDVPWIQLLQVAAQQMLVGVTYQAIKRLPPELAPPRDLLVRWSLQADKIYKMNAIMDQRSAQAEAHFRQLGYNGCILKGQGLARLYAMPFSRMPGDIDIWVEGSRRELTRLVSKRDPKAEPTYHHVEYPLFDGIEVELHYKPTWMYSPLANRRLQRFFQREARWDISAEGADFHVPSLRLNMVFVMVHIYRHFFTEGVGLRQMMDLFFVLRACHSDADRGDAMAALRRLGMKRFTAATMWVQEQCFGLERGQMLCEPDVMEGRRLLVEIMQAGNLGQFDRRVNRRQGETEFHKFVRKTRRNLHFLTHYPSEVLWSIPWRVWNWVMRTARLY